MKYCEKSIRDVCSSNKEILTLFYKKMISTRKKAEPEYRPYTHNIYVQPDMYIPGFDFKDVFDSFEDGDYVFLTYNWEGPFEKNIIHNVYKYSEVELYEEGVKKELTPAPGESLDADVFIKEGGTNFILKVIAKDGEMKASFKTLMHEIRMSARNYVYNVNQYITMDGFRYQKDAAISRLYKKDEPEPEISLTGIDWIYPVKPEQSDIKTFDFNERIGKGATAYAYTCVSGDMVLKHSSPMKVFANGAEIYSKSSGEFRIDFAKETEILIKSRKSGDEWGFESIGKGVHSLPFVKSDDYSDLKWLWIGPFGKDTEPIDHPYPPEINLCFNEPYPSVGSEPVYWNFYRENTRLRQNLTTTFYGQWFYPMMVGMNGLRVLADKLNIKELYDYFNSGMSLLAKHRDYGCFEYKISGYSDYLPTGYRLDRLDPIGTIGMNVAEYYLMTADKSAKNLLNVLADAIMHNVPRFEDGTYNRIDTMWTDDMYMSLPFLARLGAITGEKKYFDEVIRQVKGFHRRLYMPEENIFSHIYYPLEYMKNNIPWGRGNGWVLLAISEALMIMPEDYDGRDIVLNIFKNFAKGVLACRDSEEKLWHQVINNPESYIETSGSAMFITALARGIRLGWIDESYTDEVVESWEALCEKCIDSEGNLYGVCQGSGCKKEEKYYMELGTITNDEHGIGIVMGAGVEIMNLLGE